MLKKITVCLIGGLGNQLHGYAFGRALAANNNVSLEVNAGYGYWRDSYKRQYLLRYFPNCNVIESNEPVTRFGQFLQKLKLKILSQLSKRLPLKFRLVVCEELPRHYQKDVHRTRYYFSPHFLGYWATYLYYQDIAAELRLELIPPKPDSPTVLAMLKKISSGRSCSIHWRSYQEEAGVSHPSMVSFYKKAINYIIERYPDIVFFVFSDVPALARNELSTLSTHFIFVDIQESSGNEQSLNDFYLMYSCEHAIIGDSTFSWWAAWLSDHIDKTIIAPRGLSPWGDQWIPSHCISMDV